MNALHGITRRKVRATRCRAGGGLNEVGVIPHILTVLLPPTPPVALWQQQARVINLI